MIRLVLVLTFLFCISISFADSSVVQQSQETKMYELALRSAEITNNNLYRFIQIIVTSLGIIVSSLLSGLGVILAVVFVKEKDAAREIRILKEEIEKLKHN